ncbi:uncharacterized protein J4E92_003672 [Alternaria infectoria]|uniref:uncharacterized protein n=1 Tax=Alternaria infectoria TaxID=45303 RepID=UPI0022201916|nr:uncharacterized protein J4E92_003672 [Alternaria infectoria]KAI4934002.1 hypothetical protein J4E92_003672 [Alternaria infectoria]
MATVVDKTADGIIYRSEKSYPIPDLDVLTLLFDSEHSLAKPNTPLHVSAADPSLILTTSRARHLTQATSAALRKHFGIGAHGPGKDVCSIISTGHYLLPVLAYGIIGAGGIFSAASAASTASELAKQLQGASSKILITCQATLETSIRAAEDAGWGQGGGGRVLLMSEGREWTLKVVGEDGRPGKDIVDEGDLLPWTRITDRKELEESLIVLIYSSGTTGLPKGVKLSHRNVVSQTVSTGDMMKAWVKEKRPGFEYRTIAHLPTAHIAGVQGYLINPFYLAGTVYWMPRFDFPSFLTYNARYHITFFFTVPPILLLIAKSPLATTQFASLEFCVSGAAPLGRDLQNGMFYIVDRKKELIKYKGLQVAPAELEAMLLSHPLVLDAAVIGVLTDDGTNEVPRAYVVADKSKIGEKDIIEFVKGKVAGHKQLRGGQQNQRIQDILPTLQNEADQIDQIAKIRGWFRPKEDSAYYPLIQDYLDEKIDVKEATARILGPIDEKIKESKLDDVDFMDLWTSIIHSARRSTFRDGARTQHHQLIELLAAFKEHSIPDNKEYDYLYKEMTDFGMACREAFNDAPAAHEGFIETEVQAWTNMNYFYAFVAREHIYDLSMYAIFALREALETPPIDEPMSTANQKYDANVPAAAAWIIAYGHDLFRMEKDLTPTDKKQGNPGRGGELWKGKSEFSKERWALWKERFAAIAEMEGVKERTRLDAKDAIEAMERSQTYELMR